MVDKPVANGSNPTNDYGPAFYLTTDLDSAKAWTCRNDSVGIVNKYRIGSKAYERLKILDLTNKNEYSVLNWLAILMKFRKLDSSFKRTSQAILEWLNKYYLDVGEYDVVVGYRADDAYFRFPIRFISGDLAFEDLEIAFLLGHLGIQHAFISEAAVKSLKFEGAFDCEESFLGQYYAQVREATKSFDAILSAPRDPNKTYVLDLMRKDNG